MLLLKEKVKNMSNITFINFIMLKIISSVFIWINESNVVIKILSDEIMTPKIIINISNNKKIFIIFSVIEFIKQYVLMHR